MSSWRRCAAMMAVRRGRSRASLCAASLCAARFALPHFALLGRRRHIAAVTGWAGRTNSRHDGGADWAMMRFLAGVLLALMTVAPAAAQSKQHVQAELVAETQGIAPGQTIHVALRQQIEKGWHTYWRNSGDSGEATRIAWTLPAGWQAGGFTWPAPKRLPVGPLMNYGYEGEV